MTGSGDDNRHGGEVRWNPDGPALATDGGTVLGRWEYWIDDDLALWWSESDRLAFHDEQDGPP